MAWNHFLLNKVTNVTATLQDGGNLDANTTYYVKVLAIAKTTDTRQTGGWLNMAAHYSGEWSDTVTFTTTSTQRSVLLEWDRVYKHSGVEVEGYDVLVSKTGSFPHHGQILRAPDYVYPTTSNNYYLLDANANYYYRYVPYGFPYIWWSGTGTATFNNLYDYMKANIANYEKWIQVLSVPHINTGTDIEHFAFSINACIVINRSDDDVSYDDGNYTFESIARIAAIWGTFYLAGGKVNVQNSAIYCMGPGHSGGNNFFAGASNGSVIKGTIYMMGVGDGTAVTEGGIHFATSGTGRLWAGCSQAGVKIAANDNDTFTGNVIGCLNDSGILGNTNPRDIIICDHPDVYGGVNYYKSAPYVTRVLPNVEIGALNNVLVTNAYVWRVCSSGEFAPPIYLDKSYVYWQSSPGNHISWYHNDEEYGYTLYPRVKVSGLFQYSKGNLYKTIKVKVLDKDGNAIEGAKVYFLGPNDENLAFSTDTSDVVSFIPPEPVQDYSWDVNNQNPTYDTTNLWVRVYNTNAGTVLSEMEAGQEYWSPLGERIKVIRRITDATPPEGVSNWQLYEVERGVTGVRSCWLVGRTGYYSYCHYIRALPYHTTDSNGECWNITLWADYRFEVSSASGTKYIKDWVNDGILSEKLYLPVKIRVEAEGYQTFETYVGYDEFLASKNDHLYVVIKLPDQVKLLMPMGKRIYKNLKPQDGQNKILWEEI